jgi:hypothetical protein
MEVFHNIIILSKKSYTLQLHYIVAYTYTDIHNNVIWTIFFFPFRILDI